MYNNAYNAVLVHDISKDGTNEQGASLYVVSKRLKVCKLLIRYDTSPQILLERSRYSCYRYSTDFREYRYLINEVIGIIF